MANRKPATAKRTTKVSPQPALIDRRLLGTWKSDRKRTFEGHLWPATATPTIQRRYRAIFGKLVVRWTPKRTTSEMDGTRETNTYQVLASDTNSVAVLVNGSIYHIHFDGDEYYYLHLGRTIEYFCRVPKSNRPQRKQR